MTEEERFAKLADAIERMADASASGIQMLTQAQLATQQQMGLQQTILSHEYFQYSCSFGKSKH